MNENISSNLEHFDEHGDRLVQTLTNIINELQPKEANVVNNSLAQDIEKSVSVEGFSIKSVISTDIPPLNFKSGCVSFRSETVSNDTLVSNNVPAFVTRIKNRNRKRGCDEYKPALRNFSGVEMKTKNRSRGRYHLKKQKAEKIFTCEKCNRVFKKNKDLRLHIKLIHQNQKLFSCHVCTKTFSRKSNLIKHLQVHGDEQKFNCNTCQINFHEKEQYLQHTKSHNNDIIPKYKTPFKETQMSTRGGENGISQKLKVKQKKRRKLLLDCPLCNNKFEKLECLKTHLQIHKNERLSCIFCSKTYSNQKNLIQHLKTHAFSELAQNSASNKLKMKTSSRSIIKSKTNENTIYKCSYCSQTFKYLNNFQKHLKFHVTNTVMTCKICEKSFNGNRGYTSHMKTHGIINYSCKRCKKNFENERLFIFHNESKCMIDSIDQIPELSEASSEEEIGGASILKLEFSESDIKLETDCTD